MRKSLFAGLLVMLTACGSIRQVDISWGPSPWYTYCSWDAPCWYGPNLVFVYGWGYVDRPTYVLLSGNPGRREGWAARRREWHPRKKPAYRGRDWDVYKSDRDRGHDKDHGDRKPRDRNR
jgi:hypothetical protein